MPARSDIATAIVIEPHPVLADTIRDALHQHGYRVVLASTHLGAAQSALDHAVVDFLIAAVPAPGEDRSGAYLARARETNPLLRTVVMLSDPDDQASDAPPDAVRLLKPFTRAELDAAIGQAMTRTV